MGSELLWGPRKKKDGRPAAIVGTVEEHRRVKETLGPHALGFHLLNVVEDDVIEVTITARRGVYTDRIDGVGLPIYSDCPVENLGISVDFVGLVPRPAPRIKVSPLRRTLVTHHPPHLTGGLEVKRVDESGHRYAVENLLYPRPGFSYCIAFGSLEAR